MEQQPCTEPRQCESLEALNTRQNDIISTLRKLDDRLLSVRERVNGSIDSAVNSCDPCPKCDGMVANLFDNINTMERLLSNISTLVSSLEEL